MRQFVYISTASAAIGRPDVEAILEASQRNNPPRAITGFLIWNGRNFLQLIEGPQASLQSLMVTLARDPRHSGIVRIADVAITERAFAQWSMGQIDLAQDVALRREQLALDLPAMLDDNVRAAVLNFANLN